MLKRLRRNKTVDDHKKALLIQKGFFVGDP